MPEFRIGERVEGTYSGYPVAGEIVYINRRGDNLHIRLEPQFITGYIRGWGAGENNCEYGPGLYWSVHACAMRRAPSGPPDNVRDMSYKVLALLNG